MDVVQDPFLGALEDFFDKYNYIKNQVACLTDLSLRPCAKDQFCDSCCCDAVGLRLRGMTCLFFVSYLVLNVKMSNVLTVLAPIVIRNPDEETCKTT